MNFLNDENCKKLEIWGEKHGGKEDCDPIFGMLNVCVSCISGECESINAKFFSCSILQDKGSVDLLALRLQDEIKKSGKDIIVSLKGDQAVTSLCKYSTRTITVTKDTVNSELLSCVDLYRQNGNEDENGCYGSTLQGRGEKAECKKENGAIEKARCCPAYGLDKEVWKWFQVKTDGVSCPAVPVDPFCPNIEQKICSKNSESFFSSNEKITCTNGDVSKNLMCCPDSSGSIRDMELRWIEVGQNISSCPTVQCDKKRNKTCYEYYRNRKIFCDDSGLNKALMCCNTGKPDMWPSRSLGYPIVGTSPVFEWVEVNSANSKCPAPQTFKCVDFEGNGCFGRFIEKVRNEKLLCKSDNGNKQLKCCVESNKPYVDSNGTVFPDVNDWKWVKTEKNGKCPAIPPLQCSDVLDKKCSFDVYKDKISCRDKKNNKSIMCCDAEPSAKWTYVLSGKCPATSASAVFGNFASVMSSVVEKGIDNLVYAGAALLGMLLALWWLVRGLFMRM